MSDKEDKLTPRERIFVSSLLRGQTKQKAALTAGCKQASAHVQATRWLALPRVQSAIREFHEREAWQVSIDREKIRRRLMDAALADPSEVFSEDWELRDKSEVPKAVRRLVVSARKWSNPDQGSGSQVKLASPLEAAKAYLKLFPVVEEDGGLDLNAIGQEVEAEMEDLIQMFEDEDDGSAS